MLFLLIGFAFGVIFILLFARLIERKIKGEEHSRELGFSAVIFGILILMILAAALVG